MAHTIRKFRGKIPNRHQMRVMIDHMGTPFAEHGTGPEMIDLFDKYRRIYPEKFEKAWDVVVEHKLPVDADGKSTDADRKAYEFGKLITEKLNEDENKAVANIRAEAKRLVAEAQNTALQMAQEAIKEASKMFQTIQVQVGDSKPKKVEGVLPDEFEQLIQLAANRLNILMVGPAGAGKTYLASKIAEALSLDFSSQSCSAGMSESQLTGWLLPIGDSGSFTYVPSEFVRIYENGGVFLFDEIDASDPNVLIFINQALANGQFTLPQRFDKPLVKKHKDFIAVAAANTYGSGADAMYHGRNALDAATLDRFKMGTVTIDYSDVVESNLVDEEVLAWGRSIRQAIKHHNLRRIMSTRVMLDATKMKLNAGWSIKQISDSYFSDWSDEEKRIARIAS